MRVRMKGAWRASGDLRNARLQQRVKRHKAAFKKRGTMNWKLKSVAATLLAASAIGAVAFASDATPPKKHQAAAKKAEAPCCAAPED